MRRGPERAGAPALVARGLGRAVRRALGLVGTGFLALAPVILTVVVLDWLVRQMVDFIGPQSVIGRAFTAIGSFVAGGSALLGYFIGFALLVAAIGALGAYVQRTAKDAFSRGLDDLLGRVPVLGRIYRPVAGLVRSMGGDTKSEMSAMSAVVVHFGGGIEAVGFLTSTTTYDLGQGPAKMVLLPTAPVPFGGALILVPVEKLRSVPGMDFEETARLYLTMGTVPPERLVAAVHRDLAPAIVSGPGARAAGEAVRTPER